MEGFPALLLLLALPGGTGMMNEFSWKMIRVQLRKLQLNDSGEYQLETYFQGRNKPRNSTKLEVLEEYRSLDTDSDPIKFATEKGDIATDDTNKEQRKRDGHWQTSCFQTESTAAQRTQGEQDGRRGTEQEHSLCCDQAPAAAWARGCSVCQRTACSQGFLPPAGTAGKFGLLGACGIRDCSLQNHSSTS